MYRVKWNRSFERPTDTGQSLTVTEVHIVQEEPYQVEMVLELDGDFSNVAHSDVIQAVLDKFYKDTFIDRANQEKFSEIDTKLQESLAEIEEIKNSSIAEVQEMVNRNEEALLEISELISQITESIGGTEDENADSEHIVISNEESGAN